MAELSLRERLQPALLDRLHDEERLLTIYEITTSRAELTRLGIEARALAEIIAARGLTLTRQQEGADPIRLVFSAPVGRVGPAQLKSMVLRPPGAPEGVALQSFCTVEARNVLNEALEGAERRYVSPRRLREYVCRDLTWLLNCASLDDTVDFTRYPYVRSSVLNYGLRSLAGRSVAGVDVQKTALAIEEAIRHFEPRLQKVQVTPDTEREGDGHRLGFRIEAELWGQPAPVQLTLRTYISTESGDVNVVDSGGR
jgi:type VI secretion system protein ImpF